jgi:hypothetical protein
MTALDHRHSILSASLRAAVDDVDLGRLMEDLQEVRVALEDAVRREAEAQSDRVRLEAEERALLGFINVHRVHDSGPSVIERIAQSNRALRNQDEHGVTLGVLSAMAKASGSVSLTVGDTVAVSDSVRVSPNDADTPPEDEAPEAPPKLSTRDAIRALMASRPEKQAWTPVQVHAHLKLTPSMTTKNNVRVTLRRMVADEQLVRTEDGRYRLPPNAPENQLAIDPAAEPGADGAESMGASE